jgi:hypothetical protein
MGNDTVDANLVALVRRRREKAEIRDELVLKVKGMHKLRPSERDIVGAQFLAAQRDLTVLDEAINHYCSTGAVAGV